MIGTKTYNALMASGDGPPLTDARPGGGPGSLGGVAAHRRARPARAASAQDHAADAFGRFPAGGPRPDQPAADLAGLADDLGATSDAQMARLLWVLNADRQGTRLRVALRYAGLLAETRGFLDQMREEPAAARVWAEGREWPNEAALFEHLRAKAGEPAPVEEVA
jgi:hypothetical protein